VSTPTVITIFKYIRSRWEKTIRRRGVGIRREIKMIRRVESAIRRGRCWASGGMKMVSQQRCLRPVDTQWRRVTWAAWERVWKMRRGRESESW
jgi:hypothetical protein